MTFHSYQFICLILPALYAGFLLAHKYAGWNGAFRFLAIASFAFYAAFSLALVAILMVSVVANYWIATTILKVRNNRHYAGALLAAGISANIAALGYLKYANFLIEIANQLAQQQFAHIALLVPIGMSFYTFIQIGYLIEAYAGQTEKQEFCHYVLFAAFLPCSRAQRMGKSSVQLQPGLARHAMLCSCISIFPVTRIWRSGWAAYSASCFR